MLRLRGFVDTLNNRVCNKNITRFVQWITCNSTKFKKNVRFLHLSLIILEEELAGRERGCKCL